MTVIAWDGTTLAADKRASNGTLIGTTTKIFRIDPTTLCGYTGDSAFGEQMVAWYKAGAHPEAFPPSQRDKDDWARLVVVKQGFSPFEYERTPHPIRNEDALRAWGSGRDFALAALHLGKTAEEAVELACRLDSACGNGVDTLAFAEDASTNNGNPQPAVVAEHSLEGGTLLAAPGAFLGTSTLHIKASHVVSSCMHALKRAKFLFIDGPARSYCNVLLWRDDGGRISKFYETFAVTFKLQEPLIVNATPNLEISAVSCEVEDALARLSTELPAKIITAAAGQRRIVWRRKPHLSLAADGLTLILSCRLAILAGTEDFDLDQGEA